MTSAKEHRRYAASTLLWPKPPQLRKTARVFFRWCKRGVSWQKSFQPRATWLQSDAWRELAIQDADNDRAGLLVWPCAMTANDDSK